MTPPKWITFDLYGTLIDFALTRATFETLGDRLTNLDKEAFAQDFSLIRYREVLGEFKPYRDVLRDSLKKVMDQYGLTYFPNDGEAIIAAVPTFQPFPEVPGVLQRLRKHSKLVIISNSDEDLIAGNIENLGTPVDRVITSAEAGAYKPSHAAFRYMLGELESDGSDLVHVAQGFWYDIIPASELGLTRVWINRFGMKGDIAYGPYEELPDMSRVPEVVGIQ